MVRHNIKVGGMLFVPFLGAAVSMDSKPKDPYVNAYVALAGPVCGTIGSLIPFGVALTTGSQMAFALADFGFMVNLFNMAPIGMLDGGRIAPIIHPNLIYMGLAGGLAYMYFVPTFHPVFVLVLLSGCYNAYQKFYGYDSQTVKDLESISSTQRMWIIAGYFGLLVFLLGMLYQTSLYKKDAEMLRLEQRPINLVVDEEGELVLRMKSNVNTTDPEIFNKQMQSLQLAAGPYALFKVYRQHEAVVLEFPVAILQHYRSHKTVAVDDEEDSNFANYMIRRKNNYNDRSGSISSSSSSLLPPHTILTYTKDGTLVVELNEKQALLSSSSLSSSFMSSHELGQRVADTIRIPWESLEEMQEEEGEEADSREASTHGTAAGGGGGGGGALKRRFKINVPGIKLEDSKLYSFWDEGIFRMHLDAADLHRSLMEKKTKKENEVGVRGSSGHHPPGTSVAI
mmetsp:Transcript_27502/g.38386  ORF Transcript_27502/g.38386 Transcript_27502/m.38386 type:complete len:454 (+) Transcript_27502:137-1498(+)